MSLVKPALQNPARVLIVDDHPLVRDGIRLRIETGSEFRVCGEAADIHEALIQLDQTSPDLAIVDISLKEGNGLDLVKRMLARRPSLRIIISSMHEESIYAERALIIGAMGFVHKLESAETFLQALREVVGGRIFASETVIQRMLSRKVGRRDSPEGPVSEVDQLTERELEVFERIGRGKDVKAIAAEMHLSPKTVETYRDRIRQKLEIGTAHELKHFAFQWVSDHLS
jgi:DNA-binding NarL/FixJ family response regulator